MSGLVRLNPCQTPRPLGVLERFGRDRPDGRLTVDDNTSASGVVRLW